MRIEVIITAHSKVFQPKAIDLGDTVEWDIKRQGLVVAAKGIRDFDVSRSNYDSTLAISRRECALVLQKPGDAVLQSEDSGS